MAVELATGYISLVPSAKGIGRSISRELSGPLESAGRDAGDKASSAFGDKFTAGLKRHAKTAGIALGAAFGAAGTYGVKVAADFQQTRIAFEGILGSADEANKRLTELQQFAAGTPFEFKGLAESAQQLLAVGFSADDIIPTMTKLGNVAATLGVGEAEIKGVVRALGQMKGKGKASAEELQQISEQVPGFSAVQAIADDMGITVAETFKRMEKGAIPADRAITAILNGMEKFPGAAGAMERQSKTLNGVLSTFKDTINIALIQGIEPFLPAISGALSGSIPLVQKFIDTTIGGVAGVVTGFGDMARAVQGFFTEINKGDIGAGIAVEIGKLVGLAEDHPLVSALATALTAVGDAGGYAFDALSGVVGFVTSEVSASVDAAKEAWKQYAEVGVGPVADAFDRIQGVIGDVNDGLRAQKDILIPAAAAATTFAAAFVAYSQVSHVLTGISTAASALGPAIGAALAPLLASPVGIIVAIVVAIAAAFAAAYFTIQPFRDAVDSLVDFLGDLAVKVGAFVSDLVDRAVPALQGFVDTVVGVGQGIVSGFQRGVRALGGVIQRNIVNPLRPLGKFISGEILPAFGAFGEFVSALFARISDVVGPAVAILSAQLNLIAGVIADAVGPAFEILAANAKAAFDVIRVIVETLANILAPILGAAFDGAAAAIDVTFGIITGIVQTFFGFITGIFDLLTGILTGDFGKAWEGITEIIGAPIRAARDIVVNTFEETIGFLGTLPGRAGEFFTAIFDGGLNIATTALTGLADIVVTTFDGIVGFFSELPGRIGEAVLGMWDGIGEGFESVINFIIDAWNSLDLTAPKVHIPGTNKDFGGFTVGLPQLDPVDFAGGGVVTARPGGLIGRLGEAGRNELVAPLPNGFDIADLANSAPLVGELTVIEREGEDAVTTAMRELNWHRQIQLAVSSR